MLPDGPAVGLDSRDASGALSAWLGRDIRLATPVEGEERSFQMTFDPPNDEAEYVDIRAPAGSFLDFSPVHFVPNRASSGRPSYSGL